MCSGVPGWRFRSRIVCMRTSLVSEKKFIVTLLGLLNENILFFLLDDSSPELFSMVLYFLNSFIDGSLIRSLFFLFKHG